MGTFSEGPRFARVGGELAGEISCRFDPDMKESGKSLAFTGLTSLTSDPWAYESKDNERAGSSEYRM
jgi:hypothetical protein